AASVLARRNAFVDNYQDASEVSWVRKLPAAFFRGQGRLVGPLCVEVASSDGGVRVLQARHGVVVATGTDPVIPASPGIREAKPWTNPNATSVTQVPKRLVVIGGGAVGCEMSQALHSLGAEQVTVLVRGDRLLPRHEPFAGQLLAQSFAESGISVGF